MINIHEVFKTRKEADEYALECDPSYYVFVGHIPVYDRWVVAGYQDKRIQIMRMKSIDNADILYPVGWSVE